MSQKMNWTLEKTSEERNLYQAKFYGTKIEILEQRGSFYVYCDEANIKSKFINATTIEGAMNESIFIVKEIMKRKLEQLNDSLEFLNEIDGSKIVRR